MNIILLWEKKRGGGGGEFLPAEDSFSVRIKNKTLKTVKDTLHCIPKRKNVKIRLSVTYHKQTYSPEVPKAEKISLL